MRIAIEGGRVLLPDGSLGVVTVTLAEDRIIGVGHAIAASRRWHVPDLLVLPGIVDLHGDAFEAALLPRSGVSMPAELAFRAVDRQLLQNGITTAFHGLTLSWEPGLRSRDTAALVIDTLAASRPQLDCDHRVHLRFEALALEALDDALEWIDSGGVDLLAFNDHLEDIARSLANGRGATLFSRTGLTAEAYRAAFDRAMARRSEIPQAMARLATAARARGLPIASHDDDSPAMRRQFRELGCHLCEFPIDAATAAEAKAAGEIVVMGAPNVLRGGSHAERLAVRDAVADGLCDVLTSDYYYAALPAAPFRLASDGVVDLASAWRLVSTNPAAAAGLDDRGTIAPGQRADLVIVDAGGLGIPRVVATIAGGRIVHVADAALAMALEHFPGSE